jgi:transcriptional regulator with XRE-family HTH domain
MKIGSRLFTARTDKKLSQEDMAKLLNVSQSAYSRFERNEVAVDFEQLTAFAKTLQIPLQDFFPENMSVHCENHQGKVGILVGNFYSYGECNIGEQLALKDKENALLKEEIKNLKNDIQELKDMFQYNKTNF